ncbi:uncharacterized protein RAG0_11588 [Rhynchosporium agropyri]|uniref:Uncharacterized protein n=1 Tax=Rhynchosporium agropyri TaxID=914238 RepID=A0A1E1L577_9HELO|nr:uncharacterized protein RAG0_11588 [Rhynchosporium agropyri]
MEAANNFLPKHQILISASFIFLQRRTILFLAPAFITFRMPKPKQFTKMPKKRSKHVQSVPETADEYLAAGVDFEEAGEKWRGGDAAKSTRFFVRAIDCYDEALKKFPNSFDLAYNKARVQYELTQHPKLLRQLPGSLLDLLQTALTSSQFALSLNEENADALFNLAQVLTSLAENLSESSTDGSTLDLIEEALRLFQLCLECQEKQAKESAAQAQLAESMLSNNSDAPHGQPTDVVDSEESGISVSTASAMDIDDGKEPAQDARWASIVEPVTNDVLLDTVLAQLETLSQLCGLMLNVSEEAIGRVETYAKDLINFKLDQYVTGTDRFLEANITKANFLCAFINLQFQANLTDINRYAETIHTAYSTINLEASAEGLCSYAEALIAFNSSTRILTTTDPKVNSRDTLAARWSSLSKALKHLTAASEIPEVDNIVKIHIARGDVEVSRFQLGQTDIVFDPARDNSEVLLKNAGKFYVGAKNLASTLGWEDEGIEAAFKQALVKGLLGDGNELKVGLHEAQKGTALLVELLEDGLVTREQLHKMDIKDF